MASDHVINLTEADFEEKLAAATTPVLVDFWATWCGPCKMIAPILDELADETAGRFTIAKVDVDSNPGIAARFNIRAIPTLLFFKGGEVKHQLSGLTAKKDLLAKLEELA